MSFVYVAIVFMLFLGPLVFFHELGHFLFARLFGVRVETFSIGFGKKLLSFKRGDTVYAFSLIPLGGYVKMFGDNPFTRDEVPEQERKFAYNHKPVWQRFWIVFGGPLANFIMAFFLYWALLQTGEKVPEIRFGNYSSVSILSQAGIKAGDKLIGVNDISIQSIEDLILVPDKVEILKVIRNEEILDIEVNVTVENLVKYMIEHTSGLAQPIAYIMGEKEPQKVVLAQSEKPVDLDVAGGSLPLESLIKPGRTLFIQDENAKVLDQFQLSDTPYADLFEKNYILPEMMIDSIMLKSSADYAGLAKGDVLVAINGNSIYRFYELRDIIQELKETPFTLTYLRNGKLNEVSVEAKKVDGQAGGQAYYAIGIQSGFEFYRAKMVDTTPLGFFASIPLAWNKTIDAMTATLNGFRKLFTAQIPLDAIGGPVSIAKVASDSLSISASYFFKIMALMSINLGLINLFPIPILDGGHIVFLAVEAVKRGPLDRKSLEFAQRVGLSLLLALICLALFNDIKRFF